MNLEETGHMKIYCLDIKIDIRMRKGKMFIERNNLGGR